MSIFCQKNVHSLKNKVLSCHFFIFFHTNPILLCPYLVKKRIFCQNYTIFWAIKVNTWVFFQPFLYLDLVRFLRDFQKVFDWGLSVSGVFYHFFLKYSCEVYLLWWFFQKVYVWNLCVLVFFSKSIRLRFIRFTHFFENVFGLGYSFFQTNKVKVIRFSKNVYI